MRHLFFTLPLISAALFAFWQFIRMLTTTSPKDNSNVAIVLFLIFIMSACLSSLLSWKVMQRVRGEDRFLMALRHGTWAGLFLVALPILRWLHMLSLLVIGGILLIIFGLESLILLQRDSESALNEN